MNISKIKVGSTTYNLKDSNAISLNTISSWAQAGNSDTIPSSKLPSYVDDVLEYASTSSFPETGESGKIYVATDTNKTYRWGGSSYVVISETIAIGTTQGTAYDGAAGAALKSKLDGIEAGAQTHRAPSAAEVKTALGTGSGTTKYLREDGTWATPPDTNTWPTATSQLTNDSGYITGITKSMVTTALGYTPPSSDTNTVTSINGKTGAIAAADIATVLTGAGYKLTDTDTNTWRPVLCNGTDIGSNTLNLKPGTNVSLSNSNGAITITATDTNTWRPVGTGATDAAAGNHTHATSIATSTGTNQITLAHGGKYAITAGGTSYVFTMPSDNNTTYSAGTGLSLSGTTFALATSGVTAGTYKRVTVDAYGRVTSGDNTDADSWRTVQCNGTSIGNNTLNLKAGSNVSLSNSNGTITISSTDTNTWPTKTSQLTNDSGFLTSHQSLAGYLPLSGGTMTGNISFSDSGTTGTFRGINYGTVGNNDLWRIGGAGTAANAGYMELSTADDGTEPIYVRQYTGVFTNLVRTATLLDDSGNTSFPGTITSGGQAVVLTNDSRLTNSRPASDVYSWAKASSKPSYSWSEIGSRPTNVSSFTNDSGYITGITKTMVTNALGYTPPTTNSTYNFSGTSFTSNNSTGVNANDVAYNAHTYYTTNGPATSIGASTNDGALYSQAYSTSWVAQIAQDYRNGGLYVRGKNNGTWQSWYRVWDSRSLTNLNQLSNGPGYITGITKAMVTNALGYTPPTTNTTYSGSSTVTLSGTTFSLTKANVTTALGYTPPTSDTNTWRPLGTGANDACAGNDSRLSNSRPASDVYSWAKASSKPGYSYGEISHAVNSVTTSGAISLAGTTPLHIVTLNGNASSVALSSNPATGHSCHVIFFSTALRTVAIAHDATARVCPNAADVSLTVPANGYVEVDFLFDGTKTWVRGV